MNRQVRYQGALVEDGRCLLLYYRPHNRDAFWLLPGGGREEGESATACVARELWEETRVHVRVERLLFEWPLNLPHVSYTRLLTYLCSRLSGLPAPGEEPSQPDAPRGRIERVAWFSLRDDVDWPSPRSWRPETREQLLHIAKELHLWKAGAD